MILSLPAGSISGEGMALAQYIPPPAGQTFAPARPVTPNAEPAPVEEGSRSNRRRPRRSATARDTEQEVSQPAPRRKSRRERRQEARAAAAAAKAEATAKKAEAATAKAEARKPRDVAEVPSEERSDAQTDQLVVLAGEAQTTNARSAAEIAAVVQTAGVSLRPELGRISIDQLTNTDGSRDADLAILPSDALEEARKAAGPTLARKLSFVARLYNQEIHVLARGPASTIADLTGKRVAMGPPDSPGGRTAALLFERLGLKPQIVNLDQKTALERLQRGDVDAAVFVGGKPVPALADLSVAGLHLVSIPYQGALQNDYYPARIAAADYPRLTVNGRDVDTIAIGTVLVALDARPGSKRYKNLTRFTDAFFDGFGTLRDPAHHPKWREVNLAADVPGWRRFMPAQKWLDQAPALRAKRVSETPKKVEPERRAEDFKSFVESRPELGKLSGPDQDKLFSDFLRWNKEQGK